MTTYNESFGFGLSALEQNNIKWTRAVKKTWKQKITMKSQGRFFVPGIYRPYFIKQIYFDSTLNEMQYQLQRIFPSGRKAKTILVSGVPSSKPFQIYSTDCLPSYDILEKTQCLARYRYNADGERIDNITDWALREFRKAYGQEARPSPRDSGGEGMRVGGASHTARQSQKMLKAVLHPSIKSPPPLTPPRRQRGEGRAARVPSPRTRFSTTSMACCTTLSTGRNTRRT